MTVSVVLFEDVEDDVEVESVVSDTRDFPSSALLHLHLDELTPREDIVTSPTVLADDELLSVMDVFGIGLSDVDLPMVKLADTSLNS